MFLSRLSDNADMNGEDTSSLSSEEEKEGDAAPPVNGPSLKPSWTSVSHSKAPLSVDREEEDDEEGSCLPTIFFSHTVEPKKVSVINVMCKVIFLFYFLPILQFNSVSATSSLPCLCLLL